MSDTKHSEKTSGSFLFWMIVIILLGSIAYYWFNHVRTSPKGSREPAETVVNAFPAKMSSNLVKHSYIGYVTPIHEVSVTPYINGYLEDILVEGGAEVDADDVLVVIRQGEYQANLEAAKAAQMQAQADYNNASLYYKRVKSAGSKAISKTEFDNAKARFLSAQAAIAKAKADYDLAKINYDYTLIKAPISGIVGNVSLTKGNYVSPAGAPLFTIVQYNPIRVVFSIADKEYQEFLQTGGQKPFAEEKIQIRLADGSLYKHAGEFKYLDNSLKRSTSSIAVYADFENAQKELLPNAYVTVEIEKNIPNSVSIRQNMVTMKNNGNFINIIRGGKVKEIPVKIMAVSGNDYIIADSFEKGDLIVLDKIGSLRKDAPIKVNVVKGDGE